jgi:cytochrome c553
MGYYLSNKSRLYGGLILLLLACQNQPETTKIAKEEKVYVMYEPSEMAALMQEFYEYNETLKAQILAGEDLADMPEKFKAIHTAEMTDSKDRSSVFEAYAPAYIATQAALLDSTGTLDLESRYNNAIQMCLACHKTECVGPIPRIKKLLIQ